MKIKEKLSDALDMPKDVTMNYPRMTVTGKENLYLENFRGIVEFSSDLIRLNTQTHMLKITGRNLYIKQMTGDDIEVCGELFSIIFE